MTDIRITIGFTAQCNGQALTVYQEAPKEEGFFFFFFSLFFYFFFFLIILLILFYFFRYLSYPFYRVIMEGGKEEYTSTSSSIEHAFF